MGRQTEVFDKYKITMFTYGTQPDGTGRVPCAVDVIGIAQFNAAVSKGALFTKADIERARMEGEIQGIYKGAYRSKVYRVSRIKELKIKLNELE